MPGLSKRLYHDKFTTNGRLPLDISCSGAPVMKVARLSGFWCSSRAGVCAHFSNRERLSGFWCSSRAGVCTRVVCGLCVCVCVCSVRRSSGLVSFPFPNWQKTDKFHMCETSTSSSFSCLSLATPKLLHLFPLALTLSSIINNTHNESLSLSLSLTHTATI